MASQGSVEVRAYTSDAQLPLARAPVTFYDGEGTVLAVLLTDSSGRTAPLQVAAPDESQSLYPGSVRKPYASVKIRVDQPGYRSVVLEGVQIFPGVRTVQTVQMVPLPSISQQPPVIVEEPGQNL